MKQGVLALLMWLSTGAPASATTLVVAGEIASVKAPVESIPTDRFGLHRFRAFVTRRMP